MGTLENTILGLAFWAIGLANILLMFKLWGYPFDHERLVSSAPRSLMLLHRALGYLFVAIYIVLMVQMVPRLWAYQVELPARTVAHLVMGIGIGAFLFVKILIVRVFRHLESTTAPLLGIVIFVCTTILIGLSAPLAIREAYMSRHATRETPLGVRGVERVRSLLPGAGLPAHIPIQQLASLSGLAQGRDVLLRKCVQCHDLRTILARPRTPDNWADTVRRMAERAVFEPISEKEQWYATAYLVAISPDLQKSVRLKRKQEQAQIPAEAVKRPAVQRAAPAAEPRETFDLAKAKTVYESACSGCHSLSSVEESPPRSESAARSLVARMLDNGLSADEASLEQIVGYLARTYGTRQTGGAPGQAAVTAVESGGAQTDESRRDDRGKGRGRGR
jgi:mono/diheme cytochrome c family protein